MTVGAGRITSVALPALGNIFSVPPKPNKALTKTQSAAQTSISPLTARLGTPFSAKMWSKSFPKLQKLTTIARSLLVVSVISSFILGI
jgi:hypothetical protein